MRLYGFTKNYKKFYTVLKKSNLNIPESLMDQLLNDFIQDYLMHSHTHAGLAGTTAPINPLQFPTGGQVLIGINSLLTDN